MRRLERNPAYAGKPWSLNIETTKVIVIHISHCLMSFMLLRSVFP